MINVENVRLLISKERQVQISMHIPWAMNDLKMGVNNNLYFAPKFKQFLLISLDRENLSSFALRLEKCFHGDSMILSLQVFYFFKYVRPMQYFFLKWTSNMIVLKVFKYNSFSYCSRVLIKLKNIFREAMINHRRIY